VGFGSKLYNGIDKNFAIEPVLAIGMDSPIKPLPHQNFEERFKGNSNNKSIVRFENFKVRAYTNFVWTLCCYATQPFQTGGKPVLAKEKFVAG
jgi:hypothetical protein